MSISHSHDQCKVDWVKVRSLSLTRDRTWTITKTPTSYRITGNDIKPLEITFDSLEHCRKMAKTMNFGWLYFVVQLNGVSTAYHFIETASK